MEIVFEPVWTKDMMSEEAKLELGMLLKNERDKKQSIKQ